MDAEDDPIELPECLAASIGKDTKSSIDDAFARIIAEAEENGISEKGSREIAQMLNDFRDVFHILLGFDPPVCDAVFPVADGSSQGTKEP